MKTSRLFPASASLVALMAALQPASAQAIMRPAVPDAGHVLAPPAMPPPLPPAPSVRQRLRLPSPGRAGLRFARVRVTGARHVPEQAIAAVFAPLAGRDIAADALRPLLDKVNALYAEAGFPLGRAFIPAQRLAGGVLTVRVVEGYVGTVKVVSDGRRTRALVQRMAAALTAERPLTRATLERVLLLIQETPGLTLGSKFAHMDPATGSTTLILDAALKRVTVGFSLNNRSNLASMPVQPYLASAFNNVLGGGERIALTTLLPPLRKDYAFYDLALSRPLGSGGWSMVLDGAYAQSLDDMSLKPYNIRSFNDQLSAALRYAMIRRTDESLTGQGRIFYTGTFYDLDNYGVFARDRYLAAELGADYARGLASDLALSGTARLTQGLAGFADGAHTRLGTIPGFTKLRAEARLAWQPVARLTLNAGVMGQYSPGSLFAAEEIAFGGLQYGRGFEASEIAGDSGSGFSFQPEYRIGLGGAWSVTPYALFDYAKAWNRRGDQQPDGELVSTGGGMKFGMGELFGVTLELAKPLNRVPFGRRDRNARFYAGLDLGVNRALSLIGESL